MPDQHRLEWDPNLEVPPNYGGEHYTVVHQLLIQATGCLDQQAAQQLLDGWTQENDAKKEQQQGQAQQAPNKREEREDNHSPPPSP
ncbi:hypothetical protein P691DRAFT_764255 [Macrolepiota fuliginosa MF-IS2]|uniref:Uncharacterized protein n=1 Tax=Macrolepiota fuliginosa MF-IS2 TaxID=1400762 RepID=A0A9P6BZD8_9AGAR|nr:hypothetical protein P691DRAFT_764255 [Macrolepiota fuliginosa MF-IS2]